MCINLLLSKKYDKRVIYITARKGVRARGGRRGWFDQLGTVLTTKELPRLLITGPEPHPVISIHDCDGDSKIAAVILAILFWGLFVFNKED